MAECLLVVLIVVILYGALGPKTPRGYRGGQRVQPHRRVPVATAPPKRPPPPPPPSHERKPTGDES